MKTTIVSLLICFLFALAAADSQIQTPQAASTIQLDVFSGSNAWWVAVAVDASVDTSSVQIQEAGSSSWQSTDFSSGWGYFTFSSLTGSGLKFPITVRLTSVNGEQVTIPAAIASFSVGIVDTGAIYAADTVAASKWSRNNGHDHASKATIAPTARPKSKATTSPTSNAKATTAPTTAPKATATTKAPTTTSKAATTAPSGGCSAGVKLMVPLYTYPGSSWDTVAAGASSVATLAIINPNSGPGTGPDSSYVTYMNQMSSAGVEMVGYVHTSYGTRDITAVKADIDVYATQFPHIVGIFLDEAAATADELSYYQELYSYIMSMPGWKYDIINPGTVPTSGYASASTQIVSFEDTASKFASSANPSFASCSNKNDFAVITYSASSSSVMESAIASARSKGYYGWVYVTSGTDYNALPSYYSTMVSYIASTN